MKTYINFIKKAALFVSLFIAFNSLYSYNNGDDQKADLKKEFARALIGAMKESKMLREVLKTEALKMFDKDYDILYVLIKDKTLENGLSIEYLMARHLGGKEKLDHIISQIPTLTILVPELPNESFSAELWDAEKDVPAVAIPTRKNSSTPFINVNGIQETIPEKDIPGFPILVIKDNERVIVSNSSNSRGRSSRSIEGGSQLETRDVYNKDGLQLKFSDKAFDNLKRLNQKAFSRSASQPKPTINYSTLKDAYDIYKEDPDEGWQRDYIYYGIDKSKATGRFRYNYMEYLTTFSLADPENISDKIADQEGDPKKVLNKNSLGKESWTDGYFEFKIISNVNSKIHSISQKITQFTASPKELFEVKYQKSGNFYSISSVSSKTMSVFKPLFVWDLNEYPAVIQIDIEEVDLNETEIRDQERTVGFMSNVENSTDDVDHTKDTYTKIDREEDSQTNYNERNKNRTNTRYKKRHKEYKSGTEASAGFSIFGFGGGVKISKERSGGTESGSNTSYSVGSKMSSTRGHSKYKEEDKYHEEGSSKKMGSKRGNTDEKSEKKKYQVSVSRESDALGNVIVNFGDQILIEGHAVREYSTGECNFKIMPIKIN